MVLAHHFEVDSEAPTVPALLPITDAVIEQRVYTHSSLNANPASSFEQEVGANSDNSYLAVSSLRQLQQRSADIRNP
jgi:hypothetical protein